MNKVFDKKELLHLAIEARKNAYVPYSHFSVGAALLCENGKIYTGCNIESATYTPTVCAERTAFFKAVSEGERKFAAIAIVGGEDDGALRPECFPCGVCRQVMSEFCEGDFQIIFGSGDSDIKTYSLDEILPMRFKLK